MASMSKVKSGVPALTFWFDSTRRVKPSPFISTVSMPTWMRMSTPPAMVMPMAWFVTVVAPMRPLTGAYTTPTWGTIPTPSPKNPPDIASS